MSEFDPQELLVQVPEKTLPDPDEISYYILEKERKIYLDYGITEFVMTMHRMIMRWNIEDRGIDPKDRKPITIYIMSYGGDIDYMWMLVDTISLSETPIITVNMGVAASAASLIYIAGHRRYMLPNAKIVIHEGSAQMSGDAVKVMDAADSYQKELRKMKDYILSRTNIPKTTLHRKKNNDWTCDAAYCLEHGVCHAIVEKLSDII